VSTVAFVCDAGPVLGAGHVMRSLGLAEEFAARGHRPVFVADVDGVPWLREAITSRGFAVMPLAGLLADLVVMDAYHVPRAVSAGFRAAGIPVLAIVDAGHGDHEADVYVDQNLGAVPDPRRAGAVQLTGPAYALVRSDVRALRPARLDAVRPQGALAGMAGSADTADAVRPGAARTDTARPGAARVGRSPRVLAFFGGTDAYGVAPLLTEALAATGVPCEATVVAATPALAVSVAAVTPAPGQLIEVIPAGAPLAARIVAADLVIAAAGSSLWELCCLGAAAALVCVVDNQVSGYRQAVGAGVVAGLGTRESLAASTASAAATLRELLVHPERRAHLATAAFALVDGAGRARVADAAERVVTARADPAGAIR